jgi:hypothetical protein
MVQIIIMFIVCIIIFFFVSPQNTVDEHNHDRYKGRSFRVSSMVFPSLKKEKGEEG